MASYLADRFTQLGVKAELEFAIKRGEDGLSTTCLTILIDWEVLPPTSAAGSY